MNYCRSRGFLYQDFAKTQDYKDVLKYATDLGYITWFSDEKRMFVVSSEGHQRVKEFFAKRKAQQ